MAASKRDTERPKRKGPPARTLEAREIQLASLAMDLAEKQLLEGSASSQVISKCLELGISRTRLEREKLANENLLLKAKTEQLQSEKATKELFEDAIKAMRTYQGDSGEANKADEFDA